MTGERVRAQYEAFPYPPRDPADEAQRLITGSPSHLTEIDHYCFAGARDWRQGFRALIAGGGTGDGLIMLAQQLADAGVPAELVYLDLSSASRAIAEGRARARRLDNIRFVSGSLLEIAALAPGPYDYIDCCGVLHHLPDPGAGLAALVAQLAPGGGMGMMFYGSLGRTGVYPLQQALRALGGAAEPAEQVRLARSLLAGLPQSNWFARNPFLGDHKLAGDAALYDLLLHSQDRAYLVPELVDLTAGAGLTITGFIEGLRYDPALYLRDVELLRRARLLPWLEQAALAENLAGSLKTHVFYAVPQARAATALARPDPSMIPLLREAEAAPLAAALGKGSLGVDFDGQSLRLPAPPGSAEIVALIDGRRTLGDLQNGLGLDWNGFARRFQPLYTMLNGLNLLLLRQSRS